MMYSRLEDILQCLETICAHAFVCILIIGVTIVCSICVATMLYIRVAIVCYAYVCR
jgi:hypothetical protein